MTGLKVGIAVLALMLAAVLAWMLTRRPEMITVTVRARTVLVVDQTRLDTPR